MLSFPETLSLIHRKALTPSFLAGWVMVRSASFVFVPASDIVCRLTSCLRFSTLARNSEYGYPIPCLDRDRILTMIQPYLEDRNVYSRGRFGGWKYEVGNMDHSLMQGVEWVERMVLGKKECTYTGSITVNGSY